ncbi:MAG: RIP metalloprotease RseP [Flavobacteriales bacterium]|nr:MAG: RIP metalloprotease RseP [Flavobacteriales bacterium]
MEILIKGAQLILSLSILVTLHELGHFLPARWFKTRVEKFYLFFDPWFSLVKKKIGDTEFGIGWIPFGGYVKISGMVDESMDKAQMAKPAEPWEFRSKPAWQRLIIMVGGVTVNLLLGMVIYIMILWVWGKDYLPIDAVRFGVHPSEVMAEMGVEEGDRPVAVNGQRPRSLEDLNRALTKAILDEGTASLTVLRGGAEVEIPLHGDMHERISKKGKQMHFMPRMPFVVDTLVRGGNAARSTLQKGDSIVAVDGAPAAYFGDFVKAVQARRGQWVLVDAVRQGQRTSHVVQVNGNGQVGIGPKVDTAWFAHGHEEFTFLQSIPLGIASGVETLGLYVSSLKLLFTPSGAGQIGGFGAIGGLFSPTWDWQVFWNMTAFLSIILAFMNILPIPALDGGHVVFLLYEMVTGRPPHQRVLEVAQMIGMVLLLGLIIFANGNDLFKALFE